MTASASRADLVEDYNHLRVLGEKRAHPRKQNGAGLLAGHHQGHELVAERHVVHAGAVALLVHGVQESVEQVGRAGGCRVSLL